MLMRGEPNDVMLNEVQGYSLSGSSLVPCAHKTDDTGLDECDSLFVAAASASAPLYCKDESMAVRSPNKIGVMAMPTAR